MIPRILIWVLSLLLMLGLLSCSSTPTEENLNDASIAKLIDGWTDMIETIKYASSNPKSLDGKIFSLHVKLSGNWNVSISPRQAFDIRKGVGENNYDVAVVNPMMLFESRGGITRMTYIQAGLIKVGGNKGTIDLAANVDCMFRVRFYQDNGKEVNFEKLAEAYDYKFMMTPSDLLDVYSQDVNSVTFVRKYDTRESISVKIQLVDRQTKETYFSNEVGVPRCGLIDRLPSEGEINVPRTPNQCVTHIRTIGKTLDSSESKKMPVTEIFANSCHVPVKCSSKVRYAYIQNGRIIQVDKNDVSFMIPANASSKVDVSWNFTNTKSSFDSKLYKGPTLTKGSVPKDVEMPNSEEFVSCQWDEK